jgi:hypothetical protein
MNYTYTFKFKDGTERSFRIELQPDTLQMNSKPAGVLPDWTKLEYKKCPNCPLKADEHPRCPVAMNITDIADFFKDRYSYEDVTITIDSESRTYTKKTSLQNGLSSMMGIYMVTSGCPVMDKLRPLVHTHLPFASLQESMFRIISMYLLAQYFRHMKGNNPDWELHGLGDLFQEMGIVNRSFVERFHAIISKDANVNALVVLNCVADIGRTAFENEDIDDLEYLFDAYLSTQTSLNGSPAKDVVST